jgi:hypothetical protein
MSLLKLLSANPAYGLLPYTNNSMPRLMAIDSKPGLWTFGECLFGPFNILNQL